MIRVDVTRADVSMTVKLSVMDCANCGVVFAIPDRLDAERRGSGGDIWCPNGHSLTFGKSALDKAREAARQLERDRDWFKEAEKREREQRQAAERSAAAYKGQTTKLRKRAITGTCAFCHRHFANVERHVSTQHPSETP